MLMSSAALMDGRGLFEILGINCYICKVMMSMDDVNTLKAALLYIIKNSEPNRCDVYGIVKTAFYAQQMHLSSTGSPLFKDEICALPFGPVPSSIYDVLKMARGDENEMHFHQTDGLLEVSASIGWEDERFFIKEEPDMDYLSSSDIQSLDAAIDRVTNMSFNDILSATHGREWERAFKSKKRGKKIMDTLKIAEEGGADDSTLEYLKEYLDTCFTVRTRTSCRMRL